MLHLLFCVVQHASHSVAKETWLFEWQCFRRIQHSNIYFWRQTLNTQTPRVAQHKEPC